MEIVYTSSSRKSLARLPKNLAARIVEAIAKLPAGDMKRLQGRTDYRLRVGDWRVIFDMDDKTILIKAVAPRGGAYR